jgi:spore germination cell wall hydrolase CwlJ-like protein
MIKIFVAMLAALFGFTVSEPEVEIYYPEPVTAIEQEYQQPHPIDVEAEIFAREQVKCLALNAYFEARNSSFEDMLATSHVVLNRVQAERYPDTICDVIKQPKQFSWYNPTNPPEPRLDNKLEARAWEKAVTVAIMVYLGQSIDPTNGATHYHAYYVEPYWTTTKRKRIGKHFYMRVA